MTILINKLLKLRRERAWSQEKLAAIAGVSDRTIQRVEKDGCCSLDTKMALAIALEVPLSEISTEDDGGRKKRVDSVISWSGIVGLSVLGLCTPLLLIMTARNGQWEIVSLGLVWGLTIVLISMIYGARTTYRLFDNSSWIVKYPLFVKGLSGYISQAKMTIRCVYTMGAMSSIMAALVIAIHIPSELQNPINYVAYATRPLVYALLFAELWFRPYKNRMEEMLENQTAV